MLPSHTVENYLKAIFQAQIALPQEQLVQMGHLASALGVVPGTATTMVKALASRGSFATNRMPGVRLTPAGEKLAARVLRRHRLVELFLVQIMGMSWAEVHDEAENLEHAVSDSLIERMDEMLGRPVSRPPRRSDSRPEGQVSRPQYDTLLTCPLGESLTVRRVSRPGQRVPPLRRAPRSQAGTVVRVEDRDTAADSVRLRGGNNREFTIGARAASKVLVQAVRALVMLCLLHGVGLCADAGASDRSPLPSPSPSRTIRSWSKKPSIRTLGSFRTSRLARSS